MEKFLESYFPEILKQYQMYQRKDRLPRIGATVRTLRGGFGSVVGGRILKVVDYGYEGEESVKNSTWTCNYIVLRGHNKYDEYLSEMSSWWQDLYIESE